MAILTRETILGAQDLQRKTINVPEWGGEVIVTELSAARRLELEKDLPEESGKVWGVLVVFCCVDEQGEPIFTLSDLPELEQKNGKILMRLGKAAMKLNRVGAGEVEALEENFTGSQG